MQRFNKFEPMTQEEIAINMSYPTHSAAEESISTATSNNN